MAGKVPGTRGDSRTPLDVALYLALLLSSPSAWSCPAAPTGVVRGAARQRHGLVAPVAALVPIVLVVLVGLRDKTIFIAARAEQYGPALVAFALLPVLPGNGFVDMILLLKLLIVSVWIGAGVSKFGVHFANVVPPMVSNSPCVPTRFLRRLNYRDFPRDIRPSPVAKTLAHVGGTTVEIVTPLVLLFSTNTTVTLLGVALMVVFHLFITSTFPLAVPWSGTCCSPTVRSCSSSGSPPVTGSPWPMPGRCGWFSPRSSRSSSSRSWATCAPTWWRSPRRCASTPGTGPAPSGPSSLVARTSSTR